MEEKPAPEHSPVLPADIKGKDRIKACNRRFKIPQDSQAGDVGYAGYQGG